MNILGAALFARAQRVGRELIGSIGRNITDWSGARGRVFLNLLD